MPALESLPENVCFPTWDFKYFNSNRIPKVPKAPKFPDRCSLLLRAQLDLEVNLRTIWAAAILCDKNHRTKSELKIVLQRHSTCAMSFWESGKNIKQYKTQLILICLFSLVDFSIICPEKIMNPPVFITLWTVSDRRTTPTLRSSLVKVQRVKAMKKLLAVHKFSTCDRGRNNEAP